MFYAMHEVSYFLDLLVSIEELQAFLDFDYLTDLQHRVYELIGENENE
jgi:hypothetical protein